MTRIARIARIAVVAAFASSLVAPIVAAATPVVVGARAGWVPTGITVTIGQEVQLKALGSVHTAPIPDFLVPGVFKSASGPAGQTSGDLCGDVTAGFPPELLEITGPCAVDDAYFGELVGRIGGVKFAIGDSTSIVAPASGELELAVNDLILTYYDNAGVFTVIVG